MPENVPIFRYNLHPWRAIPATARRFPAIGPADYGARFDRCPVLHDPLTRQVASGNQNAHQGRKFRRLVGVVIEFQFHPGRGTVRESPIPSARRAEGFSSQRHPQTTTQALRPGRYPPVRQETGSDGTERENPWRGRASFGSNNGAIQPFVPVTVKLRNWSNGER